MDGKGFQLRAQGWTLLPFCAFSVNFAKNCDSIMLQTHARTLPTSVHSTSDLIRFAADTSHPFCPALESNLSQFQCFSSLCRWAYVLMYVSFTNLGRPFTWSSTLKIEAKLEAGEITVVTLLSHLGLQTVSPNKPSICAEKMVQEAKHKNAHTEMMAQAGIKKSSMVFYSSDIELMADFDFCYCRSFIVLILN